MSGFSANLIQWSWPIGYTPHYYIVKIALFSEKMPPDPTIMYKVSQDKRVVSAT